MSEYTENCKRVIDIIKDRPWLFRKNAPTFGLESYLRHFEHLSKKEFFIFPTMLPYKVEMLDECKKYIFNTSFGVGPNGIISMHTIIQFSKEKHLFLLWGNSSDNRETVLYGTLYTSNPEDYRTFLMENEKFVAKDEKVHGFAGILRTN